MSIKRNIHGSVYAKGNRTGLCLGQACGDMQGTRHTIIDTQLSLSHFCHVCISSLIFSTLPQAMRCLKCARSLAARGQHHYQMEMPLKYLKQEFISQCFSTRTSSESLCRSFRINTDDYLVQRTVFVKIKGWEFFLEIIPIDSMLQRVAFLFVVHYSFWAGVRKCNCFVGFFFVRI